MLRVILDTNFLLLPGKFKIDIFTEIERIMDFPYELCIIDKTVGELEKVRETASGKDKIAASLALTIIKSKGLKILEYPSKEDVDSLIVRALDKDTIVATEDKKLAKEIQKHGQSVIFMRQKKYLEIRCFTKQ